jgi:hypothetical protein
LPNEDRIAASALAISIRGLDDAGFQTGASLDVRLSTLQENVEKDQPVKLALPSTCGRIGITQNRA